MNRQVVTYLGCAMAFCIGMFLVFPVLYYATEPKQHPDPPLPYPNPQSSVSQIAANLAYISLEITNYTYHNELNSTEAVIPEVAKATVIINASKYHDPRSNSVIPKAEADYFQLEAFTDNATLLYIGQLVVFASYPDALTKTQIANLTHGIGFFKLPPRNSDIGITQAQANALKTSTTIDVGMLALHELNSTQSAKTTKTLTINLTRLGSVTVNGDSVVKQSSDVGLIESIRLVRQDSGFLYVKEGYTLPAKTHW